MTYIVGGKFGKNPFLMIDCKSQYADGTYIYDNKVVKFLSSNNEIYFCQMGCAIIKKLILMYDEILQLEEKETDVFDISKINEMFIEISNILRNSNFDTKDLSEHYLFFISAENIIKYEVNFNHKNQCFRIRETKIKENECMTSNSCLIRGVMKNNIQDFCKSVIEEEKMRIVDDLKDRYTFIQSDGDNLNYFSPHKSRKDIINMYLDLGFDKL